MRKSRKIMKGVMQLVSCTRSIEKVGQQCHLVNTFHLKCRESALEQWVLLRKLLMNMRPRPVAEVLLDWILTLTQTVVLRV